MRVNPRLLTRLATEVEIALLELLNPLLVARACGGAEPARVKPSLPRRSG